MEFVTRSRGPTFVALASLLRCEKLSGSFQQIRSGMIARTPEKAGGGFLKGEMVAA